MRGVPFGPIWKKAGLLRFDKEMIRNGEDFGVSFLKGEERKV
jgi:hypothetical protein